MVYDPYKELKYNLKEFIKISFKVEPAKTGNTHKQWWVQLPCNGWGIVDKKLLDSATEWCYLNAGAINEDWFFRESSIFVFNSLEQRTQFILAVL